MQAMGIFNCLLCEDSLDLNVKDIEAYTYNLMSTTKGRFYSNMGGWQSEFVDNNAEMLPLIDEINKRLEALRSLINFKDEYDLKVESMWINVNHPYNYNTRHTHPGSYLSGSFYVKAPDNSGNLVLKHPAQNHAPMLYSKEIFKTYNDINSLTWNILPAENKLVMFPGWVEHEVEQNLSNEDRISIAFNTDFYNKV